MYDTGETEEHTFWARHPSCTLGDLDQQEGFQFTTGQEDEQFTLLPSLRVSGIPPNPTNKDLHLKYYHCSRREIQASGGIATHMWPPSFILARFLSLNRELLKGKRAIELGAGMGIPSVVAMSCGASVKLTDIHAKAMNWSKLNLRSNSEQYGYLVGDPEDFCSQRPPLDSTPMACVSYLDWEHFEVSPDKKASTGSDESSETTYDPGNYDIILGADIIHEQEHALLVALTISKLLGEHGVAFIMNTGPFSRYGIDKFPSELEKNSLRFVVHDVPDWIKGDIEDEGFHYQFFVISKMQLNV
jgi:predicted nicotinamide N-methyase